MIYINYRDNITLVFTYHMQIKQISFCIVKHAVGDIIMFSDFITQRHLSDTEQNAP